MVRVLRILAAVVFLGLVAAVFLFWLGHGAGKIPPASVDFARLDDTQRQALVDRGARVARAGDCVACHLDPSGASELGGGYPMMTPVGTIYGTNITPSRDHGIGTWSADDLYRAIAWGVAPGNRNLYPAMPYASYHQISREDSDALYAWLMAQPPVETPDRTPDLMFPFNLRPAVSFWNALFRPTARPYAPVAGAATYTVDGHYLVNVLGHCGECHTPRNLAFAMTGDHLAGFTLEGAYAPDLRPQTLAAKGWTDGDLKAFLGQGLSALGVPTLTMYPVLRHSTRHLAPEELAVISAYLMQGAAGQGPGPRPRQVDPPAAGRTLYLGLCAGCHGAQGEGQPASSVRLDSNTTAMFADPINLVRVIDQGIVERPLAEGLRMQKMPAYRDWLTDAQMADLVNYMRQQWGGHTETLTAADIAGIKERYAPYLSKH